MTTTLGQSSLIVPRLDVGAMTWGDQKGLARFHPAKRAYGGAYGYEEEKRALELSVEGAFSTVYGADGKPIKQLEVD